MCGRLFYLNKGAMGMPKQKKQIDLITVIRAILLVVMLIALWALFKQLLEYKKGTDSYNALRTEMVQAVQEQPAQQEQESGLLEINFDELQAKNSDIVGWLAFDSVEISYPVLYSGDNSYYLRRLWDKSYNQAGSLFLEGNNKSFEDLHTIVYGHNMKNGSMFAPLKKYLDQAFFQENGGWFTLYTPEGIWRYQIFSVYEVAADDELYTVGFAEGEQYSAFLAQLQQKRLYDTGVTVYSNDHVMTLSTCTDDGKNRIVAHARRAEQVK